MLGRSQEDNACEIHELAVLPEPAHQINPERGGMILLYGPGSGVQYNLLLPFGPSPLLAQDPLFCGPYAPLGINREACRCQAAGQMLCGMDRFAFAGKGPKEMDGSTGQGLFKIAPYQITFIAEKGHRYVHV